MRKHAQKDTFDARYNINQGGRYATRRMPKWRYHQHDVAEYLAMLDEDDALPESLSS